jgi:hypothetical protein
MSPLASILEVLRASGSNEAINLAEKRAVRRCSVDPAGRKALVMVIIFYVFNAE